MTKYTIVNMTKPRKTAFCKRLIALRERLSLTQTQAAERVGVSLRAWQYWESGTRTPSRPLHILIDQLEAGKL